VAFGCHLSKIQIAFLGETKRTIPRSRPASGKSAARRSCPGCRLRYRRAAPARPGRDRARCYACPGWATSIVENCDANRIPPVILAIEMKSSRIRCFSERVAPRYLSLIASKSVARFRLWLLTLTVRQRALNFRCRPIGQQSSCCVDQLNPPSIPPSRSAVAAARRACGRRWAPSGTHMITPCARASSPPSNVSFSRGAASRHRPRHDRRCSRSSRASTICAVATPPSDIFHHSITSIGIRRRHCSRPVLACRRARGRQGQALRAAPKTGPALTAAARDGRTGVRAGTKEWLRRGPN